MNRKEIQNILVAVALSTLYCALSPRINKLIKTQTESARELEALLAWNEKMRKLEAGEDFTYTMQELLEEAAFWNIVIDR